MSTSDIYIFNADGIPKLKASISNSWRGAIAVWRYLEDKYLPLYTRSAEGCWWYQKGVTPDEEVINRLGFRPTRLVYGIVNDTNPAQEIWDLVDDSRLTDDERIVLCTTFDHVLVKKEHFLRVARAFRNFGGDTSLPQMADIIERLYIENNCTGEECIAVGFGISTCSPLWEIKVDENDEESYYNCLTGTEHWWIDECDECRDIFKEEE